MTAHHCSTTAAAMTVPLLAAAASLLILTLCGGLCGTCLAFNPSAPPSMSLLSGGRRAIRKTRLFYSEAADPPFDTPKKRRTDAFAQRMRQLVLSKKKQTGVVRKTPDEISNSVSTKQQPTSVGVQEITSIQDFQLAVQSEPITVVFWYANWCRACKLVKPTFDKLRKEFNRHGVQFIAIPAAQNQKLHVGFDITSLPYIHIYKQDAGLVEELKFKPGSNAKSVFPILQSYVDGQCLLPDENDDVALEISSSGGGGGGNDGMMVYYEAPYERVS